ncbi:hypothetical protein [Lichenicola sp.]|uniref:hypothetical protein n=1 Tax=Lichenicola sp. TaxID=2804529 RepID=UPI003B00D707
MQRHLAAGSTIISALMAADRPTRTIDRHSREPVVQPSFERLLAMMGKGSFRLARPPAHRQHQDGSTAE